MSGDLNQISQAIGALQAGQTQAENSRKASHEKLDQVSTAVAKLAHIPELIEKLSNDMTAVRRNADRCLAAETRLDKIEPQVDRLRMHGAKVAGITALLATIGTAAIAWLKG